MIHLIKNVGPIRGKGDHPEVRFPEHPNTEQNRRSVTITVQLSHSVLPVWSVMRLGFLQAAWENLTVPQVSLLTGTGVFL